MVFLERAEGADTELNWPRELATDPGRFFCCLELSLCINTQDVNFYEQLLDRGESTSLATVIQSAFGAEPSIYFIDFGSSQQTLRKQREFESPRQDCRTSMLFSDVLL